jgi:hypothetical protein
MSSTRAACSKPTAFFGLRSGLGWIARRGCRQHTLAGPSRAFAATRSHLLFAIRAGRIGTLQLDLPLDSLHRLCPEIRDTTSKGDE